MAVWSCLGITPEAVDGQGDDALVVGVAHAVRFSSALMASNNSGTCWYSSMNTGGGPDTNNRGSSATLARVVGSSRSITAVPTMHS